jgi:hypothetical protein
MSGLSSGTASCGGDAGRFLRTGDGDLKKDKMVPFFFFFFWGVAAGALTGATTSAISSSVEGGDERDESESMVGVGGCCVCRCGWGARRGVENEGARGPRRLSTHEVIFYLPVESLGTGID